MREERRTSRLTVFPNWTRKSPGDAVEKASRTGFNPCVPSDTLHARVENPCYSKLETHSGRASSGTSWERIRARCCRHPFLCQAGNGEVERGWTFQQPV